MTRLVGFDIDVPPLVAIPILASVLGVLAVVLGRLGARLARRWFFMALAGGATTAAGAASTGAGSPTMPGTLPLPMVPESPPRVALQITVAVFTAGLLLLGPELRLLGTHGRAVRIAVTVLLVSSSALAVTRLAVAAVSVYAGRRPALAPARGVARMAVRIAVAILAVLTGLQALGVPVTPLLTTLGIGSLAVALALQDTLANFFAGLYLLADRPVRPGDYIKLLDGGAEGYVDSIGWRSSRLRTPTGNTVIVPNQKLSQNILTNYHLPQPDLILIIPVTVPFESDLDRVERALLDEMEQGSRSLPDLVTREPAVRLTDLGPQGMVWSCIVRVRDFDAQGRAGHELRRRIVTRMKREGIPLSYPQQVVHSPPGPKTQRPS